MDNIVLPYRIKPQINRKGLLKFLIFVLVVFVMILYGSFDSGKFEIGTFLYLSIVMSIVLYITVRFSYRTIDVKERNYTYNCLLRKVTVDYMSISGITVVERKGKERSTYSLILAGSKDWQISDIHTYRRKDIEFFIYKISEKNQQIVSIMNDLKVSLSKVNWLYE